MISKKMFLISYLMLFSISVFGTTTNNLNDTLLHHIQDKIYDAFLSSSRDTSTSRLLDIQRALKDVPKQNQMGVYWTAYAKFYESLYFLQVQDKRSASKAIDLAVSMLEKVQDKNSETLALLAYLQSFSIQFTGGISAAVISNKVKKNAEAALKIDSKNLRVWYVLALNDYYTPAAFGGGKKYEEYLLKAISLREQSVVNPTMPSWGKSDAFYLLIGYYVSNENFVKAKEYLNFALELYPDNHSISRYVEILKDK
jgi:tetratricopeptide (TPR) repeat protein